MKKNRKRPSNEIWIVGGGSCTLVDRIWRSGAFVMGNRNNGPSVPLYCSLPDGYYKFDMGIKFAKSKEEIKALKAEQKEVDKIAYEDARLKIKEISNQIKRGDRVIEV